MIKNTQDSSLAGRSPTRPWPETGTQAYWVCIHEKTTWPCGVDLPGLAKSLGFRFLPPNSRDSSRHSPEEKEEEKEEENLLRGSPCKELDV